MEKKNIKSPHEGFVRRPDVGVRGVPAAVAEVGEAGLVPTKVRTLLQPAHTAQRVLEIRIDLELYFIGMPYRSEFFRTIYTII